MGTIVTLKDRGIAAGALRRAASFSGGGAEIVILPCIRYEPREASCRDGRPATLRDTPAAPSAAPTLRDPKAI